MTTISDDELLELLRGGESDRVEFKESLGGDAPKRIREAICAFANDLPGHGAPGVVFVGIHDDGSSAELPITDKLLLQLADMKTDGNTVPPPTMTVQRRTLPGGDAAVVIVMPSDSPPVRCRGAIHVRTGPRRGLATAQDERILNERRRSGEVPFDVQRIPRANLDDLDLTYFTNDYLPRAFSREVLEANDRSLEEQLAATKMIASHDDPTPTVLGLMVIGKNPHDFIPGFYVQFLRIEGENPGDDIIDEADLRGALAAVLRRLDEKLEAHNRTAVDFISDRIERRTSTYPIEAVQQITRNAVMHRNYEGTNAPVYVRWYNDRIEVMSPGGPYGDVTAYNFGKGAADYRNRNLADVMRTLGFVQRFGFGIPIAQRLLREAGQGEVTFNLELGNVLATIPAMSRT